MKQHFLLHLPRIGSEPDSYQWGAGKSSDRWQRFRCRL